MNPAMPFFWIIRIFFCVHLHGPVEEVQLLAYLCIAAFPEPGDLFLLTAHLAERWVATVTVPLLAPEHHHSREELVTLLVLRKGFPERRIRNDRGELVILYTPQFFPEIAGKIGDLPGIPVAVKAAEPAIRNHLKIFRFL